MANKSTHSLFNKGVAPLVPRDQSQAPTHTVVIAAALYTIMAATASGLPIIV